MGAAGTAGWVLRGVVMMLVVVTVVAHDKAAGSLKNVLFVPIDDQRPCYKENVNVASEPTNQAVLQELTDAVHNMALGAAATSGGSAYCATGTPGARRAAPAISAHPELPGTADRIACCAAHVTAAPSGGSAYCATGTPGARRAAPAISAHPKLSGKVT